MILRYDLPKQYKTSTNAIYSGNLHWRKRKQIADYFHNLVKADCKELKQISGRVIIIFQFYFKSRYLDSSNVSFMAKMLEDGLVTNGLLKDDTNKYIKNVTYESVLIDPKERKKMRNDYVRICVEKAK